MGAEAAKTAKRVAGRKIFMVLDADLELAQ